MLRCGGVLAVLLDLGEGWVVHSLTLVHCTQKSTFPLPHIGVIQEQDTPVSKLNQSRCIISRFCEIMANLEELNKQFEDMQRRFGEQAGMLELARADKRKRCLLLEPLLTSRLEPRECHRYIPRDRPDLGS